MLNACTDEDLMLRFREGEAAAFDVLYQRYRTPLFNFVTRSVNERALGEDLYQEIWERLIAARSNYRPGHAFKAYLFRIARNRLIDHFRARAVPAEPYADDAGYAADANMAARPDQNLLRGETRKRLNRALLQLPWEQREVFLLRREYEHGVEEIADITGVEIETVRSRLRYAVRKLRAMLDEEPEVRHE